MPLSEAEIIAMEYLEGAQGDAIVALHAAAAEIAD